MLTTEVTSGKLALNRCGVTCPKPGRMVCHSPRITSQEVWDIDVGLLYDSSPTNCFSFRKDRQVLRVIE